jgi:hypothetical protein
MSNSSSDHDLPFLSDQLSLNDVRRYGASAIVALLAFAICLFYVTTFGVNVPFWDEWQLLARCRDIILGSQHWWNQFAAKHNEHLAGSAFLFSTLQLLWTGFNSKLQLVTGVVLQAITFVVLTGAIWKSISPNHRPYWLGLSALICFSLSQHKNLLWAFQTAWFLVTFFLAVTLASLHHAKSLEPTTERTYWLTVAIASAFMASFTSAQGVIVWIAGAAYLLAADAYSLSNFFRNSISRSWILAATITGLVFSYIWFKQGGGMAGGGGEFSLRAFFYIFLGIHGAFWGDVGVVGVAALGLAMLSFVALALFKAFTSHKKTVYALPVALIVFGTCFVLLVAMGRAKFGTGAARDPHYTAYSLMTYLGVLSIFLRDDVSHAGRRIVSLGGHAFPVCVLLATFSSAYDATVKGIEWRRTQGISAAVLLKYREMPDFLLSRLLFGDANLVRKNAEFMEANGLGVFGDAEAVPQAAMSFVTMPSSMTELLSRYPDKKAAITQAWLAYQAGGDLQRAFDPTAHDFANKLITWCYGTTRDGGHYLTSFLTAFANDYEAIHKSNTALTSQSQKTD